MKPLKLAMCAFGSYVGEETIDFTALGDNGLYLITGETGSGKTTIFDAVSYALFGKASGSTRNKYQMLRSDYAQGRDKTFVSLDFASGGSHYQITRAIIPHIARKTNEVTYTDSVSLTLPDNTVLDRDNDVRAKILEVVGLDRDQFAQIVMIAQNDFLRFLQSGTDERVKILRRIFDTEQLKQFQDRLKTKAKAAYDEHELILRDFERNGIDPYKRDEQFALWEKQIATDAAAVAKADENLEAYGNTEKELAGKIAIAEELAKKFTELTAQRKALNAHREKADDMTALDKLQKRGETALRQVKPLADKANDSERANIAAKAELTTARKDAEAAQTALALASKALDELPPPDTVQTAFDQLKHDWEQATGTFKRLTTLHADFDGISAKQTTADKLQSELAEIENVMRQLPPLDVAQTALDKLKQEWAAATEKLAVLSALQEKYTVITRKQIILESVQGEFETLNAVYRTVDGNYKLMYERFLRAQAGVLAQTLADGVACPVCGSTAHPAPAKTPDQGISESELQKLLTESETVKKKLDGKATDCAEKSAEIRTLTTRFLEDLAIFSPDCTWEGAGGLLDTVAGQAMHAVDALSAKKNADQKALATLEHTTESTSKRRAELSPRCTELSIEIATLTARFLKDLDEYAPGITENKAETELSERLSHAQTAVQELTAKKNAGEKKLAELKENRETAAKKKTDSEAALKSALTLVIERENREHMLQKHLDEASFAFLTALTSNGFADEAEYISSLVTWDKLASMNKQLTDYAKAGEQLARDIDRLEAETAGKEEPDLEKLKADENRIKSIKDALSLERDETKLRLDKTSRLMQELRKSSDALVKVEKEYSAVKGLSDVANGKLDFETYAQMSYFDRVLRAANQRLKVMSQNRYTLHRKEESSDKRSKTGLEIEVADSYTGKRRSSNSLSGGESFMASLSLALGLSDVVSQRTGGIRLDAMFIDEGFGSLDAEVLELAVRTLSDMAGTNRIIGIISHVTELRERIDKQVRVEKTTAGSRIHMVV